MIAWHTETVRVTNSIGLHARPSVSWIKLAKKYSSRIQMAIDANGPWVDGKSIVKVMALKARHNSFLHIRASGIDAAQAITGLKRFVECEFDEDVANAKLP